MQKLVFSLLVFVFIISACSKKEEDGIKLNGYAQKGAFVTGGKVTIIELDKSFNPTGKIYSATIEDNTGKFTFPHVNFASSYVQLQVTGQAFDEVNGTVPNNELTLYSTVDISSTVQVNINSFTHLVAARLKVLVDAGISFVDAKKQAEKEVLKVFNLDSYTVASAETLDLTSSKTEGGILLLLSAIIQSNIGSGQTLQEYITNLATDFKDNGTIDSPVLQNTLATSAKVLDIDKIKTNLNKRYSDIGVQTTLCDIKPLLKQFLTATKYPTLFDGLFPSTVNDSINLISSQDTILINKSSKYTIAIDCPANNAFSNIQILITSKSAGFSITDAEFFSAGSDTQFLTKQMTNTSNLHIPILFTGAGQLTLQLRCVVKNSGIVYYPIKTVIWK